MIQGLHHITLITADAARNVDFYTRDPDGHVVELATAGPGFLVDEDEGSLGTALKLPPQYERHRAEIEPTPTPLAPACWRAPAGVGRWVGR
jgi:catechol 2,3-dioxygenase-like lactoylglutathione lyase family enzyme